MEDRELQELLESTARRCGVVGAQLAIYDGRELRVLATGYRNLEQQLPVTPETLFQIGSTTKLLNAAVALSLVDDGTWSLDAPVREYIRDLRLADEEAQKAITLRQLLSMTSGLDNGPYYDFGRGEEALLRYVDSLSGIPQIFSPGSAYGYSNAGTNVAGFAAARVTGQTWEQLVRERIWDPLKLEHSAFFAEDLLHHPVALGYVKSTPKSGVRRAPGWSLPRSMSPAGGLACCSAGDLVRLGRLFLNQGRSIDSPGVLSEAAVADIHFPQVSMPTRLFADEWCTGPYRKQWGTDILYGHSGTNLSGSSLLLWCPTKGISIATTVNVAKQGYPLADAILDVVCPKMFGIDKPLSVTPENVVPVETDLQPYVGRFEAFGMIQAFNIKNKTLTLTSKMAIAPEMNVTDCPLIPLGSGRFLPSDLRVSANRNWDMAFWGNEAKGRPTHLLQGIFPLRRTS